MIVVGVTAALSGCSVSGSRVTLPPQSSAPFTSSESTAIKTAVTDAMQLSGAPGAIVGVWAPWAGSYQAGLGTTTRGGKTPVSTSMAWRIGSVTKPMTCTVLLSLVQEGKVALDDPVTKYLPRMAGVDGITLGQLCQNTSGLGDYEAALGPQFVDNPLRDYPPLELVSEAMGSASAGTPGRQWSYSNAGFVLLGMALQQLTGQSWQSLYEQDVFSRLGMSSSELPAGTGIPHSAIHGYATALDDDTGAVQCGTEVDVSAVDPTALYTANGVTSTLGDLHTFARAFASSSLLQGAAQKAAWSTTSMGTDVAPWQAYGMGGLQLGPMRGHSGEAPGFITSMLSDPASGLTIVVMLNDSTSGAAYAQALAMKLAAIAAAFPASAGKTAPKITLQWTADAANASMLQLATCRPAGQPAAPAAAASTGAAYQPIPAS